MNWLGEFFFGLPAHDESGGCLRRAEPARQDAPRESTLEHGFSEVGLGFQKFSRRIACAFARAFKKLPRRLRAPALACMIAASAGLALYAFQHRALARHFLKVLPSLPSIFPATSAPAAPLFNADVLAIDAAAVERHWKYIVIHHSASTRGSAQIFDQAHRERGWRSLGYHFVIGNGSDQGDGVIAPGPRWYSQEAGAHAHSTEHNEYGIGICLVGNFDLQKPSPAQWSSLVELVATLSKTYAIPPGNIVGHNAIRQGGSTACPGKNFPIQELREAVFFGK